MKHAFSRSILFSSLLALGIAMSLPASGQSSGSTAGQGSSGQGASAGQGSSASGQGSNAPTRGAPTTAGQTTATGQTSATSSQSGTSSMAHSGGAMANATTVASSDKKFVEKAFHGGLAEVKLGQLAVSKAQTPEVKQFAQRMVDDHGKANQQLEKLAGDKGIDATRELDKSAQHEYNKLDKLSGAQFDREYMSHMVSDHQKDIKEFQKAAKSAKDPEVKSFAESTLPTLNDHLAAAKSAQAAAKNGAKTGARTTSKQAG